MLNDTGLAVARRSLVDLVEVPIAGEVLRGIAGSRSIAKVHALHTHIDHVHTVTAGKGSTGGGGSMRRIIALGGIAIVAVRGVHAARGGDGGVGWSSRTGLRDLAHALTHVLVTKTIGGVEGSGVAVQSTLDGVVVTGRLTGAHVAIIGHLPTVADGASRNTANAGVVVVEVLLGMVIRARVVLNRGDIVGREGALQLGRSRHHVVVGG